MNYCEYNDRHGRDARLTVQVARDERTRALTIMCERDIGCVTLTMRKDELRARLKEAFWAANWWRWPWFNVSESEARDCAYAAAVGTEG